AASESTVRETLTSAVAMRSTLILWRAKTANRLARKPAWLSILAEATVSTVTGARLARAVMGRPVHTAAVMVVKRPWGRPVWRTVTGIPASTAGWMVAG